MVTTPAGAGFRRAQQLEAELLSRWPNAWSEMDRMRHNPPVPWPEWCLLPMAAAAAVAAQPGGPPPRGHDIAALSAVYAWRFCRSVYLVEPVLMSRLLTQIPDAAELEDVTGLPEWCVLLADGEGLLWMHLEHDVNTGRPELRLLIDLPGRQPLPIPVYLDRPSLTEAIADMRATTLATLEGYGQDVRGGDLDSAAAALAEQVERYVAIAAYLARPEALIAERGRPGVRPVRTSRLARGRRVWLVGQPG